VGFALTTSGTMLWAWHEAIRQTPPFPSSADAAYLAAYLAFALGITLCQRQLAGPGRAYRGDHVSGRGPVAAHPPASAVVHWRPAPQPRADAARAQLRGKPVRQRRVCVGVAARADGRTRAPDQRRAAATPIARSADLAVDGGTLRRSANQTRAVHAANRPLRPCVSSTSSWAR
jgi:hypothetical protein